MFDARRVAAVLAATLLLQPLAAATAAEDDAEKVALQPELVTSADSGRLLQWITASRDNGKLPFIVIDKQAAAMLLYVGFWLHRRWSGSRVQAQAWITRCLPG